MSRDNRPGIYGKLPILGDFISRRLPAVFVRTWDDWLQGALAASREQLGSQWLDSYLTSPVWRFVLSSGNCGANAWAGILMPSVDKVGRYFPLTLAVLIDELEAFPYLCVAAADWFDRLEKLALTALEKDVNLEEFDRKLQEQVLPLNQRTNGFHCVRKDSAEKNGDIAFYIIMENLQETPEAFIQLSAGLLEKFLPVSSLWITNGSERMKPSLFVYNGLPPTNAYTELLIDQRQQRIENTQAAMPLSLTMPNRQNAVEVEPTNSESRAVPMQWYSSACSTVGKCRKINEDAYLERPEIGLWAVADGMGGHKAGDVASKAVVDALSTVPANGNLQALISHVSGYLQNVNDELLAMAKEIVAGQIIGTTIVVMLAVGNRCASIWAGDSRLYRYRRGLLSQLTRDHSLVADLVEQDMFTQTTLADKANSNILTRALGAEPDLPIDTITFEAKEGDAYLLCSDGLVKELNPQEMAETLNQHDCSACSQGLIDLALAQGARDNVTAIVVRAGRHPPLTT